MDQKAFRSLLGGASGTNSASQQSSDAKQAPPSHMRAFGLAPKRRAATAATGSNTELFQPRKIQKTGDAQNDSEGKAQAPRQKGPRRNANTGEIYQDRAAARRKGKGDEFEDAEKVLDDFNAQNEDIDKEKIHEQMKHLGGDEKHTVLVKGLDFALLEANKARLRQQEEAKRGENGSGEEDAEAANENVDLDQAFESAATGAGESGNGSLSQKKHAEVKVRSKFRPIGAPSVVGVGASEEEIDLGPIGPDGKPQYKIVNGKRMRRKKKAPQGGEPSVQASTAEPPKKDSPPVQPKASTSKEEGSTEAASVQKSTEQRPLAPRSLARKQAIKEKQPESMPPPSKPASPPSPPVLAQPHEPKPPPVADEAPPADMMDDDEDIFAGVEDWKGVPDDDASEEEGEAGEVFEQRDQAAPSRGAAASVPAAQPAGKGDWFSATGAAQQESELEIERGVKLPGSLEGVLQRAKEAPGRRQQEDEDGADPQFRGEGTAGSDEEGEEGEAMPMRLQGFRDSALPSDLGRQILAQEKEMEENIKEKRKQKRAAKKKAATEGMEGGDADADGEERKRK